MQIETNSKEKFFTKPIAIIFVTIMIDLIGFGIMIPVLPYYVKLPEFHASPFEIGMLFAVYSLMQFIFSPILGGLSDKYGRRPILFFSLLGTCLAALITGLSTTLWMVFIGRMLDGVTGGNISTAQAYIADVTTKENRAKGMGLIGAAFGLGFILGPVIGGLLSKFGTHVPFFFVSALALTNAVSLYFFLPESRKFNENDQVSTSRSRLAELLSSFQNSRLGIVVLLYFLIVVAFSIMTTAFAQYTMFRFQYDAQQNGYLFGFIGILAIILQGGLFSVLAKEFGEKWLVVIGCLLLFGSLFAVPYVGPAFGGLSALLIGIAFFAIGNSLSTPALTSVASKESSEEAQGKVLGTMQSAASLARAIGPALTAILLNDSLTKDISDVTLFRTFWTASAIMLVTVLISVYYALNDDQNVLV
jgi:DHA1 family tetracycline resistance protein-like MFS transporter